MLRIILNEDQAVLSKINAAMLETALIRRNDAQWAGDREAEYFYEKIHQKAIHR